MESLFGREISLFPRADSKCVTSFTSGNGLNFTNVQCNLNNKFNGQSHCHMKAGFL